MDLIPHQDKHLYPSLTPVPHQNTQAEFRFNGGMGAILCGQCRVIIRSGHQLTPEDWKHGRGEHILPPQYCSLHSHESNPQS